MNEELGQPTLPYGDLSAPVAPMPVGEVDDSGAERRTFEERIGDFIDSDVLMTVEEQMALMTEFWTLTGRTPPQLTAEQQASIAEELAAHPERRVMPTPMLDFADRKEVAEKVRAFSSAAQARISPDVSALYESDESTVYGQLLRNPGATVDNGGKSYGLFYKLPHNRKLIPVSRDAFVETLEEAGQIIRGEDGTPWVYPVMKVGVKSPRSTDKVGDILKATEPTLIPETLIAMQLLHLVNDTPNSEAIDFGNEAVYRLDKNGNPKKMAGGGGVAWNAAHKQLSLIFFEAGWPCGGMGSTRMAESGLNGVGGQVRLPGEPAPLEGFPPGTYL